jgi:hypothetical protein
MTPSDFRLYHGVTYLATSLSRTFQMRSSCKESQASRQRCMRELPKPVQAAAPSRRRMRCCSRRPAPKRTAERWPQPPGQRPVCSVNRIAAAQVQRPARV